MISRMGLAENNLCVQHDEKEKCENGDEIKGSADFEKDLTQAQL